TISFSPQMLSFEHFSHSAKKDAKRSPMWENLQKGLNPKLASKYENELTPNEMAYVQLKCGVMMELFGYSEHDPQVPKYGDFEHQGLLEAHIDALEPHEKAGYQDIDADIRERFERWSSFYRSLVERPFVFDEVR